MKRVLRLSSLFVILAAILTRCAAGPSIVKESDAYYKEGLSYLDNDPQRAFVSFQKAIQLHPKNRDAHYALGHIYFIQGRNEKARDEFRIVLKIDPGDSEAHNYLGNVYGREGEWDKALYEYREALKNLLYATPEMSHYNLSVALMNKGDLGGALKELDEAVKINPNHILDYKLTYNDIAQRYLTVGKIKEAIAAYQSALQLSPNDPEVHFNLGIAYMKDGMNALAKAEFETVIKLAPGSEMESDSRRYLAKMVK